MSGARLYVLGLFLLLAYSLAFQGLRGLWEPDEGRYVSVALQMIRSNDWLHPALNDDVPHWTKPPLTYWALASSMNLFGRTTFAARLPNGIAFFATLVLVFYLGRIFVPRAPWSPVVIFATFLLPSLAANVITTDTLLTLFVTAAMTCFAYAWWSSEGAWIRRYGAWLGWCAFGLALLTKGPAALPPLGTLVVFHLMSRHDKPTLGLSGRLGLMLFLLLGCSWYFLVIAENPQLGKYFVWEEFALRVFSGNHGRHSQWYGAIVTYTPVLLLGTLPWTRQLAGAIVERIQMWWRGARGRAAPLDARDKFLLLWFLVPLTLFIVARSRMLLYLLPLFVPAALVAARSLEPAELLHRRRLLLLAAWSVLLVGSRVAGSAFPVDRDARAFARHLQKLAPGTKEVVFVETTPYFGVSLYLDSEVESVRLDETDTRSGTWETVGKELMDDEPGRIWIVPVAAAERFVRKVREEGFDVKVLGDVKGWKHYRVFMVA